MTPSLEVNVTKRFAEFTLNVAFAGSGGPIGLLGASGAGKSMVLRAIAGLLRPDTGKIVLDGRVLFDAATGQSVPVRSRRVGLLFQNYALFPHLTVEENVAFGLQHLSPDERARRTAKQIAAMHLDGFEGRYPAQLSGGQQQRVALARALAPAPAALLLDEPFSALDTHLRGEMERQLRESLQHYSGAMVLVSHNLEELFRLCKEFVVLEKGSVIAQGSREAIFSRPPNRATAQLTGCKNFSRARMANESSRIEAADWGCELQVSQPVPNTLAHVAIRAHHIAVRAANHVAASERNCLPVWLSSATEGPFRVTLYLRLHGPASGSDYHLQAEVTQEQWTALRTQPLPWIARLDPDRIFLLSD
jgi:molybdate transport system permease protein